MTILHDSLSHNNNCLLFDQAICMQSSGPQYRKKLELKLQKTSTQVTLNQQINVQASEHNCSQGYVINML